MKTKLCLQTSLAICIVETGATMQGKSHRFLSSLYFFILFVLNGNVT